MIKKFIKGALGVLGILVLCFVLLPTGQVQADATNKYWVGGTGNWSDAANHWADSSGGAPGAGNLPTSATNVHFDANSFTGAGQTVTVDAAANCLSMDWTGATNTPTLAGTAALNCYGNLTFISGMVATYSGTLSFSATSTGKTVTHAGLSTSYTPVFSGLGGSWIFQDAFSQSGAVAMQVYAGTLNTNGMTVTVARIAVVGGSAKGLILGASTINLNSGSTVLDLEPTPLTFDAGTSTINILGTGTFKGASQTFNIVNFLVATSTITGSNTMKTLGLTREGVQTITFTDGTTQTVTNFTRNVGTQVKTLQGSGVAGWAITKAGGGTAYMDYISVSRSTASPAATFIAGVNSTNGGNNVDWTFVADVVTNNESDIETHEATARGTITTNGSNATRRGFQYGTVSGALTGDWFEDGSFATGAYSVRLTGLAGDTTYYYRAYSVTGGITEYGAELSFVTRDAAWLIVSLILPIVVAFGLILGAIGAWGGNGKMTVLGIAIGVAGFVMIQAIISTI